MKYFFKKNIGAMFLGVLIIVVSLIMIVFNRYVYDVDYMSFSSLSFDATITSEGDLNIVETFTVDFDDDMHGFTRDIVTGKNSNGVFSNQSYLDEDSVVVEVYDTNNQYFGTFSDATSWSHDGIIVGASYRGDTYPDLGTLISCSTEYGSSCESIDTYVTYGLSPRTTFVYSYTIIGAVTSYADCNELNWNFWGPSESIEATDISVTIHTPVDVGQSLENFFYGHGSNGYVTEATNSSITYNVDQLYPGDVLEQRLILPAETIATPHSQNYIDADYYDTLIAEEASIAASNQDYTLGQTIILIADLFILIVLIIIALHAYNKYDKELVSDFDSDYYRELPNVYPPAEMGYLYNFKEIEKNDVSATLMDLIRRGYIRIDYFGKSLVEDDADYALILTDKPRTDLKIYETELINWFFNVISDGKKFTLKQVDTYCRLEKNAERYQECNRRFVSFAKSEAGKNDFFDYSVEKASRRYSSILGVIIVAAIVTIFVAVNAGLYIGTIATSVVAAVAIVITSYVSHIKRRSVNGNEEFVRWRAFKNFLENFGTFEDYSMPMVEVWEHYLVYAVSFGIADKVEAQFKFKFKKAELPADYQRGTFYRYPRFYYVFNHHINTSFVTATNTIVQARAKNASGGHGGFGGGRSFGGGGGGARGR